MGAVRWVIVVVAVLLLTSVGGLGVFAAPVTVPVLLVLVATSGSRSFDAVAAGVVGLTLAEVVWVVAAAAAPGTALVVVGPLVALVVASGLTWRRVARPSPARPRRPATA